MSRILYSDVIKRAELTNPTKSHFGYSITPYQKKLNNMADFFSKCMTVKHIMYEKNNVLVETPYIDHSIPTPNGYIPFDNDDHDHPSVCTYYDCWHKNCSWEEQHNRSDNQFMTALDKLALAYALGMVDPHKFIAYIRYPSKKTKYLRVLKRVIPVFVYIFENTEYYEKSDIPLPTDLADIVILYAGLNGYSPFHNNGNYVDRYNRYKYYSNTSTFYYGVMQYLKYLYYQNRSRNYSFYGSVHHSKKGYVPPIEIYTKTILKFLKIIKMNHCCWCVIGSFSVNCDCCNCHETRIGCDKPRCLHYMSSKNVENNSE